MLQELEKINSQALKDLVISNRLWFRPYPIQLKALELFEEADHILFSGGNRVGKTLLMTIILMSHLTGIYPTWWKGRKFDRPIEAMLGTKSHQFISLMRKRIFFGDGDIPPAILKSFVLHDDKMAKYMHIKHVKGVSVLWFKTYNQKQDDWNSMKLNLIVLDEPPPEELYTEAKQRLLNTYGGNKQGLIFISATFIRASPVFLEFSEHAINGEMVLASPGEVVNRKAYMFCHQDEVSHLSEETKRLMFLNIPEHEREARISGVPSMGTGLVYAFKQELVSIDSFNIEKEKFNYVVGMDFGWTNFTALILLAICKATKKIFVIGEYAQKQLTPSQHINYLRNNPIFKNYIDWVTIVHDPAGKAGSITDGKSVASLYSELGLNMVNANNSVELGIEKTRSLLSNGQLKIFSNCRALFGEMRMYSYKDFNGKIQKGNDHLLDALRYAVMGLEYARSEKLSKIISFKF